LVFYQGIKGRAIKAWVLAPRFYLLIFPSSIRAKGVGARQEGDERGSISGGRFAKRSYLVSAKRRRVRRMTANYASKSALDREGSLLDDSDPAKGGTAWATPFTTSDRGPGGENPFPAWAHGMVENLSGRRFAKRP
jgi:hypothetical protein